MVDKGSFTYWPKWSGDFCCGGCAVHHSPVNGPCPAHCSLAWLKPLSVGGLCPDLPGGRGLFSQTICPDSLQLATRSNRLPWLCSSSFYLFTAGASLAAGFIFLFFPWKVTDEENLCRCKIITKNHFSVLSTNNAEDRLRCMPLLLWGLCLGSSVGW